MVSKAQRVHRVCRTLTPKRAFNTGSVPQKSYQIVEKNVFVRTNTFGVVKVCLLRTLALMIVHFCRVNRMRIVHPTMRINGLLRQNLNGTGTGTGTRNLTKTNGFLDIMLSFHTSTGVGLRKWVSNPFCTLPGDLTGEITVCCTVVSI